METGIIGVIATALFAMIGWIVNINSKVNVQEQRQTDITALIDVKFEGAKDNVDAQFDGMDRRLDIIERLIRNGSHK